jgi:chlorophyllide a reductase subunit Y
MVSFFDKVGTGDRTGYGWEGIPQEHAGAKDRYRRVREAKAKAAASQSMGT